MAALTLNERHLRHAAALAGVRDRRVLDALDRVDRTWFLPHEAHARARVDQDAPIEIGRGQTTSQPSLVARILEDLHLRPGLRVLEVGTGLGYEAALAGTLVAPGGSVLTIERDPVLAGAARDVLEELAERPGFEAIDVEVALGDGIHGAPGRGPFDAIIVAATATTVPEALTAQLADLGRLVIPLRTEHGKELMRFDRHGERIVSAGTLGLVRYVPLLPGIADEPS